MKRRIFVLLALMFAIAGTCAAQQTQVRITQIDEVIYSPCTDEEIHFTGERQDNEQIWFALPGPFWKFKVHVVFKQVTGVGLTTGDLYTWHANATQKITGNGAQVVSYKSKATVKNLNTGVTFTGIITDKYVFNGTGAMPFEPVHEYTLTCE